MGIRFRCPNGHKLHVKAFLAGKRGICPHCGEKFQIPLESDPELLKTSKHASEATKTASEAAEVSVAQPQAATNVVAPKQTRAAEVAGNGGQQQPITSDGPTVNVSDRPSVNGADQPSGSPKTEPGEFAPTVPTEACSSVDVPAAGVVDPIDEAPHAVWYVRPPSGGQFGPASADVMRSWIAEGRVTADSLVWREGWPEWKQAGPLFPRLANAGSTPSVSAVPQIVTHAGESTSAELYRRRRSNKSTLMVVFLLLIACLILFGALVYVVRFMN